MYAIEMLACLKAASLFNDIWAPLQHPWLLTWKQTLTKKASNEAEGANCFEAYLNADENRDECG